MVFAAGRGTRLQPLTNDRPKALVEVEGKTLLQIVLTRLRRFGFTEVVVNLHHFGDMIADYLQRNDNFGLNIHLSRERDTLLDTGGGLLQARQWLDGQPFLVHNVDILTDLNPAVLLREQQQSDRLATLAVRQRSTSRYLLFTPDGELGGWRNDRTGEQRIIRPGQPLADRAFSGVSAFSPDIFHYMPTDKKVFSLIDVLLNACADRSIIAHEHDSGQWLDVGKPAALDRAAGLLSQLSSE